jgi:streptogramin lyase
LAHVRWIRVLALCAAVSALRQRWRSDTISRSGTSRGPAPALAAHRPSAHHRGNYYFTDYCSAVVGRIDLANGNAAYAFGSVPGPSICMLVASDGALLVLTQTGIVRFTAP